MTAQCPLYELTQQVRDLINHPREQSILSGDRKLWNQLCSSLDVIEDTELAIRSFLDGANPGDNGGKYLYVYGVLQALFAQQYAIEHLFESLSMQAKIHDNPVLTNIREVRNRSIGHPSKKDRPKPRTSYHFIS